MQKIGLRDIRKGDKIRMETSTRRSITAVEYVASFDGDGYLTAGERQYYLLGRPFQWPTEPGLYTVAIDKQSVPHSLILRLNCYGEWTTYRKQKPLTYRVKGAIESGELKLTRLGIVE